MLVLIQFNKVIILNKFSKPLFSFVETPFENISRYALTSTHTKHFAAIHSPIINLKVAVQSFCNSILMKPVFSFTVIFNFSYRNFISTVRLSKDLLFC